MMINQDAEEKAKILYEKGLREAIFILEDGRKVKERLGRTSDNNMIIMAKGKKTRGYYFYKYEHKIVDVLEIIRDKRAEWVKKTNRVITLLNGSGLWEDVKKKYELALEIGYDKLQEAREGYWTNFKDLSYEEQEKARLEKIKAIDKRFIAVRDDGSEYLISEILDTAFIPKIKKMSFGYAGNEILREIADAMKNKVKYHSPRVYDGYDKSFEYDGDKKAWYSEEYRNCGNGHYYLALNSEYAVFYEDD